ncbi:glycosyltransferase family 2 protein [Mucilaginibacter aquatilis]|uniref:Glycosyltransferase n=1 Tax=Mucilaginibacter aquatilis TaxID=1517760 RepID=A0A6I4I7P3_9SPHI|nr:glycosyltransferase [Mucilaginibacter aquatilis]MVN91200.1 glycosyltransferase [Mucilaginibacter aquatilis]
MVSIVILAYNRVSEVLITLEKVNGFLKSFPYKSEIIVVDNASNDNTSEAVSGKFKNVKLITKPANNGVAGWNSGFEEAIYDYMLVLDDDSHIEYGLKEAIDYLQSNPQIGVLGLEIEGGPYQTLNDPDKQQLVGFIGCGAIIRKELYKKIGGFAEWLVVYGHEWDYGIRCIDAGYTLELFKKCKVFHRVSTLNRSNLNTYKFSTRNELMILHLFYTRKKKYYQYLLLLNHLKWRLIDAGFPGLHSTYSGWKEFKKMEQHFTPTPVSVATQNYYTSKAPSLRPFFSFLSKVLPSK